MLIAMCGLPGTGKSTLSARLASELHGVVISKDVVRSSLFPLRVLDYTREQDDLTMRAVYEAAALIHRTQPGCAVILDGRTYLRAYQVQDLLSLGKSIRETPRLVECVCADDVVRERLERDLREGTHPARNRSFSLYLDVKAHADRLTLPRLVLDTGVMPLDECVVRAVAYLQTNRAGG